MYALFIAQYLVWELSYCTNIMLTNILTWGRGSFWILWMFAYQGLHKLFLILKTFILVLEAILAQMVKILYGREGANKLIFLHLCSIVFLFFLLYARFRPYRIFGEYVTIQISTLYGRKRPYNGGLNCYIPLIWWF